MFKQLCCFCIYDRVKLYLEDFDYCFFFIFQDVIVWFSFFLEGNIQVGWCYKFCDYVIVDCIKMLIGVCVNLKLFCEICVYWNLGVILKVGFVIVRMLCDDLILDVIGWCKVINGSKQVLNMMWFVLVKFFYGIEILLMNFKGICFMVRDIIFFYLLLQSIFMISLRIQKIFQKFFLEINMWGIQYILFCGKFIVRIYQCI